MSACRNREAGLDGEYGLGDLLAAMVLVAAVDHW